MGGKRDWTPEQREEHQRLSVQWQQAKQAQERKERLRGESTGHVTARQAEALRELNSALGALELAEYLFELAQQAAFEEGCSVSAIARTLGITRQSVQLRRKSARGVVDGE